MIQQLEITLISFFSWYFTSPGIFGLPIIVAVLALLTMQFFKQNQTTLPGLLGLTLLCFEIFHWFWTDRALTFLASLRGIIDQPGPHIQPLPDFLAFFLEPIFTFFIAPPDRRFVYEEGLFVFLALYLVLVIHYSIKEYRTTGVVVGDLSLSALLPSQVHRPKRSELNELGSGDLASIEDIAKWIKTPTSSRVPGETRLRVKEVRGPDGSIAFKSGDLVIEQENRNRHILAVAKTGSGKTTKLILPVLYNDVLCSKRSTIVIDSKPEMWGKLAALTRKYNPEKNILLFNPLDAVRGLSWNILSKIEEDTDCKLIANTIIMATDNPQAKSDSPFFRNNALAVLNSIMVGLLHDENDTLSMPRIHELIQSGMKPLCDWLEAHPEAYRTSRTFVELVRSGSQNADTIMSELGMRVSAWDLKTIRKTTAIDELDIEDLVTKPTLFIVEFRESEVEMLRPLANVIVIELLRFLTKYAEKTKGRLPRPVGLVIDEFASALGRLPDIHIKLNTLRSRNVSIVAAIQSIGQIKAAYGDDSDSVLTGFSTRLMMPSLDVQDAEWASKESGQMTIRFETASSGSNRKIIEFFASKNLSTQEQVQQRAVLTPDEIGRPDDKRITFFLPETAPFQGHLVPFYEQPELRDRINACEKTEPLEIRSEPIDYVEAPAITAAPAQQAAAGGLPAGISNTKGWSDEQVQEKLTEVKKALDWENTTGSARKWWEAFENENSHRVALVLRLAEELKNRNATITEFFLAYVYSNTDNIQANLHYLDYTRLKKEEERKKREAAEKAEGDGQQAA